LLRGYHVMKGYFEDPQGTRDAIDAEGWLHTGDVGVLDARGYLRITDRLKDMFIAGGFNCYPAEIERVLSEHPAIGQVSVVGVPDARLGEVGCACVIPHSGAVLEAQALIGWARERMANYKVPRHVLVFETFPLTVSAKVLKRELAAVAAARLGLTG
jgi:acyl-CoA synthetase (AMP-forming)/AMP-acid ligase II